MPEPTTTDGNEPGGPTSTATTDTFTPITSQEEFDKALGPRLERERGKFADYEDLKTRATKYDELEQANKSEIERANDRATQAEAKVSEIPATVAAALRDHFTALYEISDEDAELFLTATDPTVLVKQVNGLIGRAGAVTQTARANGNRVPLEGTNPPAGGEDSDMREFVRGLFPQRN